MKKSLIPLILLAFIGAKAQSIDTSTIQVLNYVFLQPTKTFAFQKNSITFTLTVVNNGGQDIPDLGVTNRSIHVNLYINGVKDNPLSLYNGLEISDSEKTIKLNESAEFSCGWNAYNTELVKKYGKEFTVQWEYMGKKSNLVKVNMFSRTIQEL